MAAGVRARDLADLELAYAPPFSSAKDPVNMLGYMAENILSGECDVVEPHEIDALRATGWTLLDAGRRTSTAGAPSPAASTPRLTLFARTFAFSARVRSWFIARSASAANCEALHEMGLRHAIWTVATGPGWPPTAAVAGRPAQLLSRAS